MGRPGRLAVLLAALALAGCGSGGNVTTVGGTDLGGGGGTGGLTGVVTTRTAVVSADVDGDALPDLVAVARDGSGAGACWRNLGRGAYVPAPASWHDGAALTAVVEDTEVQDDAALAQGFGVHRAACATRPDLAYALVHLGDGVAPVSGAPVLDAVEPASGTSRTLVRLEGSGLAGPGVATTVTFGGTSANVLYAFPDLVLVVVPAGLPLGPAEVRVARGDLVSAPMPFDVVAPAPPVVTSVVPSTLSVGGLAVLEGDHLGTPFDRVEVTFTGAAPVHALGLGRAVALIVPAGALSGPVVVAVEGLSSDPFDVTIGDRPVPHVTALVPAAASPGSLVRIEGEDLLSPAETLEVTFGGVRAAVFSFDLGSLTAIVPVGATDGDVVVRTGGRASVGVPFDVTARGAPHVTSVDPASGGPGALVEVLGTDLVDLSAWKPDALPPHPFLGDLKVTVGGKEAWFVLPSADGLRLVVPAGAGAGGIVVTVDGVASAPVPFDVP